MSKKVGDKVTLKKAIKRQGADPIPKGTRGWITKYYPNQGLAGQYYDYQVRFETYGLYDVTRKEI